jgi:hypothetical protein
VFTYSGALSGLDSAAEPNLIARSFSITADLDVPEGGGDGMIVTLGGRFGGFGLYLLKGKPVFLYNLLGLERFRWEGQEPLAAGKHNLVFDFRYDGPGVAKGGTGILKVDGVEVASRNIPRTIPFIMTIDETFDIGEDTRTPVDDHDYQVPFRFTGTIDTLTVRLGRVQLAENDIKAMHASLLAAKD